MDELVEACAAKATEIIECYQTCDPYINGQVIVDACRIAVETADLVPNSDTYNTALAETIKVVLSGHLFN